MRVSERGEEEGKKREKKKTKKEKYIVERREEKSKNKKGNEERQEEGSDNNRKSEKDHNGEHMRMSSQDGKRESVRKSLNKTESSCEKDGAQGCKTGQADEKSKYAEKKQVHVKE